MCDTQQALAEHCRACGVAFGKSSEPVHFGLFTWTQYTLKVCKVGQRRESVAECLCVQITGPEHCTLKCGLWLVHQTLCLTVRFRLQSPLSSLLVQAHICAWSAHSLTTTWTRSSSTARRAASAASGAATSSSTATPAAAATPSSCKWVLLAVAACFLVVYSATVVLSSMCKMRTHKPSVLMVALPAAAGQPCVCGEQHAAELPGEPCHCCCLVGSCTWMLRNSSCI